MLLVIRRIDDAPTNTESRRGDHLAMRSGRHGPSEQRSMPGDAPTWRARPARLGLGFREGQGAVVRHCALV